MRQPRSSAWLFAVLLCACVQRPAPPRAPRGEELAPETVVVNYAPTRLRVFPDWVVDPREGKQRRGRYVLMATEYPQLFATWRPLGVTDKQPPEGQRARAGEFVWFQDHIVESAIGPGGGRAAPRPLEQGPAQVVVYDRDGRKGERLPLSLPAPCTATEPALLQVEGERIYGALRCPREERALLLVLDGAGKLLEAREVPGAARADAYLRVADADLLLSGQELIRVRAGAAPQRVALAGARVSVPGTRELLVGVPSQGGEAALFVVDGGAGLLQRFDPLTLRRLQELSFPVGGRAERARAVVLRERLLVLTAERDRRGLQLVAVAVPLGERAAAPARVLIAEDPRPAPSDFELVPVLGGDEAILVRSHGGPTGPLVALQRLRL